MATDLRGALARQALRSRQRFLEILQDGRARQAQQQLLKECLASNAQTRFGREHGLEKVAGLDDYRRAVPLRPYEELAPWIEAEIQGEAEVLTCEGPVRYWKTTGTTATPKILPWTASAAHRSMESFLIVQGTQSSLFPTVHERPDALLYTHLSPRPHEQWLGPGRLPCGTTTEVPVESGRPGREQLLAPWLMPLQARPLDEAQRLYFLLCFAAGHDLRGLGCLHPSRFQTVCRCLHERADELLDELQRGTVAGQAFRAPQPQRAAQLRSLWRSSGQLLPRDLWPGLQMLTSWSGAYLERYRPFMEGAFGGHFLPQPSMSSEGFVTVTVDDHPLAQPLQVRQSLFEFVDADLAPTSESPTRWFWELTPGQTYELVITTLAGLYRYATRDLFRVEGWLGEVPRLEYVGRRSVCDLTGEKLAEQQVEEALKQAWLELNLRPAPAMLVGLQAENPQSPPGYRLLVESAEARPLADFLDRRLQALNSRYAMKRQFGDLAPLLATELSSGALLQGLPGSGPAGQRKQPVLQLRSPAWLQQLLQAVQA